MRFRREHIDRLASQLASSKGRPIRVRIDGTIVLRCTEKEWAAAHIFLRVCADENHVEILGPLDSGLGGWGKPEHACKDCGVVGGKLWRYASTSCVELCCAFCAAIEENEVLFGMNDAGQHIDANNLAGIDIHSDECLTDWIGNYTPAIPHPTGGRCVQPGSWRSQACPTEQGLHARVSE